MKTDATSEDMVNDFEEFPKIPRLKRDIVISEKIDGTNAQIFIAEDGQLKAGSRSRWITPEDDNFGFARWVREHEAELRELGPGRHFGEWWGAGIQRRYGLTEKRFSLFNASRWTPETVPACCHIVPILYQGKFNTDAVEIAVENLRAGGSVAAPGFMNPEGVIVYVAAARNFFKVTIEKDDDQVVPEGCVMQMQSEAFTPEEDGRTVAAALLRAFIDRIERLAEERQTISADIKEVYLDAKGTGFDTKAIRAIVKLRGKDQSERQEEEAVLALYCDALGIA